MQKGDKTVDSENTHRWGKDNCSAGLQFNKTGTDQWGKYNFICIVWSSLMQPCKTEDQPYSDASPNSECSLVDLFDLYLAWRIKI